ncbi:MAG TPA: XylR family transcriptional regulator [Planctomycetaceae bacterium]|nr:XylR family transcriptional regulator [Planctomycetaceae bacterium]
MRHVAILIETSRAYGRGLLRGIARFNREHGQWSIFFQPQGLGDPAPAWLASWKGDGILARIDNRPVARAVQKAGVPVVNMRGTMADLPFPFIGSDNLAIAQLAAEHLLERGFRHFAFCGYHRKLHPKLGFRGDCFQQCIEHAGYHCDTLQDARRRRPRNWEQQQAWIANWIDELPKPIGILAANDDRGLQLLDACRRSQIAVPDQVAVLGVDNDEYLCDLSLPSLSSIDVNSEETGYQAAALLDRLMNGKRPPKTIPEIKPAGVIVRRSTDVLATNDEDLVRAFHFIREHACRPISPDEVVEHVSSSRSSLESRCRSVLGRSLHQEIRKVQIDTARTLLADTDLPIKQVALRVGFKNVQYLTRVFRSIVGQPPAEYRRGRVSRTNGP